MLVSYLEVSLFRYPCWKESFTYAQLRSSNLAELRIRNHCR